MLSEADEAIIQHLEEHGGKALQKTLLSDLRVKWNEGYLYGRIRTLQSRSQLTKEKDSSGQVLLVRVIHQEISA